MAVSRFGKWSVTGKDGRRLLIRCDCGTESRALPFDLRSGKTTMCRRCKADMRRGVKRPEVTVHGFADSPTQWVWSDMKRRCLSPSRRGYENYGGRGITVCARWLNGDGERGGFACFLADMGARPSARHQIDRIDNDGPYEPGNCRWVDRDDQNYNKRTTFRFEAFGRSFDLKQAAAFSGLPRQVIWRRISRMGIAPERALSQPLRVTR
jgi:hypothetical protein